MSSLPLIIDKIEEKNSMMQLCSFESSVYEKLTHAQEWIPMQRVLMDSDQKHLIYVVETPHGWEYIRFPLKLWKTLDYILIHDQDLLLVTSVNGEGEAHKSFILKDFHKECKDLIENMRGNANYGEDMSDIVEEHFAQTINQLV